MTTLRYYLIKLYLLWWLWQAITPDSEAVLAASGGDLKNPELRTVVLELLLGEVRHENNLP